MKTSTKIAYNTFAQIISKFIATILGLITVSIITRYLGKEGFGQYTTILTFLSFFGIIADLGLTLVTVQMISRPGANENKILNNLFSLRLVSALIFLSLAPIVVLAFPYEPVVKVGVAIATFSFLFTALNQILVGLFQKKLRMDKVSISEVIGRAILVLTVLLSVKFNYGLNGIIWATVISSAVSFFLHFLFAKKFVKIQIEFDFKVWKEILIKSWPLAITIFFNLLYLKTDILFLSLFKDQASVGIYGASYKVIDVLITIPFMFAGIILPLLTFSWESKNLDDFKRIMQKSFDFMAIIALPFLIGTQFVASRIMILIAGEDFSESGAVLKILSLAAAIIFLGTIFSHAVIALDKQKKIIGAYVFTSLSSVIAYLIFIPKYSYFGAAWITVYSELAIALFSFYYVWKFSKYIPNFKIAFKALIASAVMALAIYTFPKNIFNSNLYVIILIGWSVIVYFGSLYLLRGVSKKDIMNLLNK